MTGPGRQAWASTNLSWYWHLAPHRHRRCFGECTETESSELHHGGSNNTNFLIPGHLSSDESILGLPIWPQWAAERSHLVFPSSYPGTLSHKAGVWSCELFFAYWDYDCDWIIVSWSRVRAELTPSCYEGRRSYWRWLILFTAHSLCQVTFQANWKLP